MTMTEIETLGRVFKLTDENIRTRSIYVKWLYNKFGLVTMTGLVDDDSPVRVEQMFIPRCFSKKEIAEESSNGIIEAAGQEKEKEKKKDILYWLNKSHLLMIAGLPGSGKTWLVHELALEAGISRGTEFNNSHPWIIPIPLILREYRFEDMNSLD